MNERVFLGVGLGHREVSVVSSSGARTRLSAAELREESWVELVTFGIPIPEPVELLVAVAIPARFPGARRQSIHEAARYAGWDALWLVPGLRAAARRFVVPSPKDRPRERVVVVVDPGVTSLGVVRLDSRTSLLEDDSIHAVEGREAREVAVSLRCLLKTRGREERRALCREVWVVGDQEEVERVGRRRYEEELGGVGVGRVRFELDAFALAEGAVALAREADRGIWRRGRLEK